MPVFMDQDDFFVVGIGASAGGIEALTKFFSHLPQNPGLAFVVIQHLNPDYPSKLTEILSRNTSLAVHKVQGGEKIAPNQVFVIPEGKKLYIKNRILHLIDRPKHQKKNTAINFFFKSLATDIKEKSIGIILSGTGTDGLEGVKQIEEYGGVVMVQDPVTAEFSGMPENTIHLDHPQHVLPPDRLPQEILHYIFNEEKKG